MPDDQTDTTPVGDTTEVTLPRSSRPDRKELLAIRDGAWTFDELEQHAEESNTQLRATMLTSTLPDTPDEAAFDNLCASIIERELNRHGIRGGSRVPRVPRCT